MEEKPLKTTDIQAMVDRFIDIREDMEKLNKEAIAILERINGVGRDTERAYGGWYKAIDNSLHNDGIRSLADMDETIEFLIDYRDSRINGEMAEFALEKAKQGISFTGYSKQDVWDKFAKACKESDWQGVDCWYSECIGKGISIRLLDMCIGTNGASYDLNPQGV